MAKKKETKSKSAAGKAKEVVGSALAKLQKAWKKAKPKKFGKQAPDGDYAVKIKSVIIEKAKSSGRMQIKWTFVITEGDYKGRELTSRNGLDTQDNLEYLKGDLETIGIEAPDDITELKDVLQEAIGTELEVSLITRGEFQNISFNGELEPSDDDEEDDEEGEDDEDSEDDDSEEDEDEDEDEDSDEGEDEDEEDEDEDAYPSEEEINEMDEKTLKKHIKEYELDIDPKGMTLKKLRKAVIDASVYEDEDEDEDEEE